MNQKDRWIAENNVRRRYRSREGDQSPKVNVVYLSRANTHAHELKKAEIAFDHMKEGHNTVTEAIRRTDNKIIDMVFLTCDEEFEVVAKNDVKEVIERYKAEEVTIIYA